MSEIIRYSKMRPSGKLVEVREQCTSTGHPTRHYRGYVDGRCVFAGRKYECISMACAFADGIVKRKERG